MAEKRKRAVEKDRAEDSLTPAIVSQEAQRKAGELLDILSERGIDPAILVEGVMEQTVMKAHRGPLPPPDDLQSYDQVLQARVISIVDK